jgi:hypothetical protein
LSAAPTLVPTPTIFLDAGLPVERINLVLQLAGQNVQSVRIGAKAMQQWAHGDLSDGQYFATWT